MSASSVQIAPDSTGKKIQTFENTVGGQVVEAQAVVLADSSGAEKTTLATTVVDGGNVTLGAQADAAASTDTGTFSLVAFIKRSLQNWTTLLAKTWPTKESQPSSSAVTSVANSTSNVTLLSSNASRRSATVFNDDTAANLYVKLGATASTSSFTIKMAPGGYYEFPYPCFTGQVDAIASAATGSARITEMS